jgi:hypothetical protein
MMWRVDRFVGVDSIECSRFSNTTQNFDFELVGRCEGSELDLEMIVDMLVVAAMTGAGQRHRARARGIIQCLMMLRVGGKKKEELGVYCVQMNIYSKTVMESLG